MSREQFLTWSEGILEPCAAPGAKPAGGVTPYRSVRIAPRQYLGIDALHDGTLRVYLYSTHIPLKAHWMRLRDTLENNGAPTNLEPPLHGAHSRLYMRDNGEEQRGFLGFEWRAASKDFSPERDPLSQYVTWLLHVTRKG